ncbi:hypothetical protein [Armatimonas sp.]|uniref:hypothetical protein n=1 Tax=Armatimonas sp. TaxID=1872638 RepID=UPI0037509D94
MATITIEERVAALEERVAQFIPEEPAQGAPKAAWWKKLVGVYKNDTEFAEAGRLGREYRESLRPQADDAS